MHSTPYTLPFYGFKNKRDDSGAHQLQPFLTIPDPPMCISFPLGQAYTCELIYSTQTMSAIWIHMKFKRYFGCSQGPRIEQAILHRYVPVLRCMPQKRRRRMFCNQQFTGASLFVRAYRFMAQKILHTSPVHKRFLRGKHRIR